MLVGSNSRGWMEDRLSGSQGRVDRLLKTVEWDVTASAHANSPNRHTVLVRVIAVSRRRSECPLFLSPPSLPRAETFHLRRATRAARSGRMTVMGKKRKFVSVKLHCRAEPRALVLVSHLTTEPLPFPLHAMNFFFSFEKPLLL